MTPLATILAFACALLSLALIGESAALLELRSRPRRGRHPLRRSSRRWYLRLSRTLAPTVPLRSLPNPSSAGVCRGWTLRQDEIRAALALDVCSFLGQEALLAAMHRVRSARAVSINRQGSAI
jgi:hypothetical protein